MKYQVIRRHEPDTDNPIRLIKGELVIPGEEATYWKNWTHCTTPGGEKAGWVPAQILKETARGTVVAEDYDAIELTVEAGQILELLKVLNEWGWCRTSEGVDGWVPMENLAPAEA
ncbi:SH3 domain-containing protein [Anoxynatronum buryatiense]|uniref:Variant SH3 domain-containing protein n=1 Tax=Anoxynatronum buryatiense TaxID=489973 RepID=A0AA45WV57_9CLOT|nr:SH3 domain-containing protein [Anoxynatronum buryatiense]SMP51286.1 Variant SH3 domain-containing protein [Anoxynatronum buryatiense]